MTNELLGQYTKYSNKSILVTNHPNFQRVRESKYPLSVDITKSYFSLNQNDTSFIQRFGCYASICDSMGNLLLYPHSMLDVNDGVNCELFDKNRRPIINSRIMAGGGTYPNQIIFLPNPGNQNQVYVIYTKEHSDLVYDDVVINDYYRGYKLLFALVDLGNDNQATSIVVKDELIDTKRLNGSVDATLHANGRDWWIVVKNIIDNSHHVYLLNEDGFLLVASCQVGPTGKNFYSYFGDLLSFSESGKYIISNAQTHLSVFTFDRCSGLINEEFTQTCQNSSSNEDMYCNYFAGCLDYKETGIYYTVSWGHNSEQFEKEDFFNENYIIRRKFDSEDTDTLFSTSNKDNQKSFKYIHPIIGLNLINSILIFHVDTFYCPAWTDSNMACPTRSLGIIRKPESANPVVEPRGLYFGDQYTNFHARQNLVNYSLGPLVTAYADPDPYEDSLTLCTGDSVRLGRWADERHLIYEWRPDDGLSDPTSPTPWAKPERTTTYTLTVRPRADLGPDCATRESHSDTITVHVRSSPPPFSLGPSRFLCPDQWPVQLSGPAGPYQYRWSTGDTSESILAFEPGTYALSISDADDACPRSASVDLNAAESPELPAWQAEYEICPPASRLSLGTDSIPGFAYRWNDGSSTALRAITAEGHYSLTITNEHGCTADISTFVRVWPPAEISPEPLPSDTWCPDRDGAIRLTAHPSGHSYEWNMGERTRVIQADTGGAFRVVVRYSDECSDSALIWLPYACADAIYIPNVFSPNGDGVNDEWHVRGGPFAEFACVIHDRWGRAVFQTSDPLDAWDGDGLPEGAYTVVVRCRILHSQKLFFFTGTVELLR